MHIHTLDLHFQGTPGLIAAYLIESGGEYALIETGPGSTLETKKSSSLTSTSITPAQRAGGRRSVPPSTVIRTPHGI